MNFEKPKSSIERVVGSTPEFEEKILKEKAELFDSQIFETMKGKEREVTEEEEKMIDIANEATNALRRKYGMEDFNIPAKNFHMVSEEEWAKAPKLEYVAAFYHPMMQGVAVRDKARSKVNQFTLFMHEMLHFKSYNALQGLIAEENKTESKKPYSYRVGFTVASRDGKKEYFTELNEAITEELTKRTTRNLVSDLRKNPIFSDEIRQTEEIIGKYPHAVIDGSGKPLFTSDTLHAENKIPENSAEFFKYIFGKRTPDIRTKSFMYPSQRRMLNSLIDKVWNKHKDIYKDQEEVFNVFAKAYMTGNLLTIGRLIEDTFGEGTFRKIGGLDMGPKKKVPHKSV